MTLETMQALLRAAGELGIDATGRDDYSGRGMYGRSTCAITIDSLSDMIALAAQAGWSAGRDEDDDGSIVDALRELRSDSMGRGIVVY